MKPWPLLNPVNIIIIFLKVGCRVLQTCAMTIVLIRPVFIQKLICDDYDFVVCWMDNLVVFWNA